MYVCKEKVFGMQDPHGTSIRMQVPQGQVPWMVSKEGPGDLPLGGPGKKSHTLIKGQGP